jgi:pyruvate dehydrogenase E2 component (dihydrolipoamide acetyltransferase)
MFNHGPLGTRCPTLALDLPGHGGSSHDVGDGGVATLARALDDFLAALGIERAHLVGHSLGGAVVLALALDRPERAASLTLLGPAGFGPEMHPTFIPEFIAAADREAMGRVFGMLFGRTTAFVSRDLLDAALVQRRLAANDAALERIAAANFHDGRQRFALKPRLGEVAVPVKVVWGGADRIVPAAQTRALPGTVALHLFEGGGHMMHMEEPQAINRLILENTAVEP